MAQLGKLIGTLVIVIAAVIVINFLLKLLSNVTGFAITGVLMTINWALAGIAAGIGFYIAKQLCE